MDPHKIIEFQKFHVPITHVPHPQGAPSLSKVLTMISHCPCVLLPICQIINNMYTADVT